jgi:hypothetical protein
VGAKSWLARQTGPNAVAAAVVVAWASWWYWHMRSVSGLSWHFFADGSGFLLHGSGLGLYADHPELQTGPLSLAVAALLRPLPAHEAKAVALVAMAALGPLLLAALAPMVAPSRRTGRLLLVGLLLVPAWMVLAVRWGHLDDVLAMTAAVLAVRAVGAGRPVLAGVALGAAVAAKPWAVGFLPLLLALPRDRVRAFGAAALTGAAAWLPFALAHRSTLRALHPRVALVPASGLHVLGARGQLIPWWGRPAQLLLAPAVAAAATLTGRWPGVLLVAVAVRLALEPQDNAYYIGAAALAAAVFDLLGTSSVIPWTTLVTVVALLQPFVRDYPHRFRTTHGLAHWWFTHQEAVGAAHMVWSVLMVAVVIVVSPSQRGASAAPDSERAGGARALRL